LLAGPFWLGLLPRSPWAAAWLALLGSLWLTRGLHWDGWADLCDAWGSRATGERFWQILKDSRTGAFGAMGLFMGLSGQLLLLHHCLGWGLYAGVGYCFVFGRGLAVGLMALNRDLSRPGLGAAFLPGATPGRLAAAAALTLGPGLWALPAPSLAAALLLGIFGLSELTALARRHGGLNGDFLGCAIVWGELSVLLALVLTSGAAVL
ncbi:MAG: adenosylcobinamide-GDP ribazoletransferase, partial [Thermodesulfobacteriota bacterium]